MNNPIPKLKNKAESQQICSKFLMEQCQILAKLTIWKLIEVYKMTLIHHRASKMTLTNLDTVWKKETTGIPFEAIPNYNNMSEIASVDIANP